MESAQGSYVPSSDPTSQPTTRRQARVPLRRRRTAAFPANLGVRWPHTAWGRVLASGSAVVVLLVLWAMVASLTAKHEGPAPASESATSSADYKVGDCFADFDGKAQANRVVACTYDHSAQLVAVTTYAAGDSYPGKDALESRASELCRQTKLNIPQDTSSLKQSTGYPTQGGWGNGDRRVDCFVVSSKGNSLTASLLP
ncbi:septum formation family protein [Sinomonas sp. ASV322]|uniref:septum formation family protein n=1 Tax=Sinomonas sp. ASV322 TaxID=3041920 RepID=UPI0027DD7654|nr:septum formation family protein [Sinomonas sp. ASV322]MDQ4502459.1 septum formation family protein [Sinomonas sp. ASV322]